MLQRKPPKQLTYEEKLAKVKAAQERARLRAKAKGTAPRLTEPKKTTKPKTETVAKLKKQADTAFSILVRLRDSEYKFGNWWCQCITCGAWKPIKEIQNGHFMSRRYMNTRFNEQNCNAQCVKCNVYNAGEQYLYGLAVDRKYGPGTAEKLRRLALVEHKFKTWELKEMIESYKERIKEYERKQAEYEAGKR